MNRISILLLMFVMLFICTGCVSMTANHYQDAHVLGKGNVASGANLGFGRGIAGISSIDSSGYVIEAGESSTTIPMMALGLTGSYGFTDQLDVGAEIFTTLFSNGGKIFGKYQFTDSSSAIQMAILGGLGYGSGKVSIESSGGFGNSKTELTHRLISIEVPLLLTYSFSDRVSLSLSPKLYYYILSSSDVTNWSDTGIKEEYTASQNIFSPAISMGLRYKSVYPEITFLKLKDLTNEETVWLPLIGVGFYGWEGILDLVSGIF